MNTEVYDFSKVKIRCSSLGCLFTEPKAKIDKDAGNLSETAKSHLIKVYIKEYWGREKKIETKQMSKGTIQEDVGIRLLSDVHGIDYYKNPHEFANDFIRGTPDIIHVPTLTVIDTKLSWEADTFLPNLMDKLDKLYYVQLQGYLYLTGMDYGKVSYCLVDATERQIMDEKRRLLYTMDVVSEESPEYVKACEDIDRQMTYNDIPKSERVIDKIADRDEEIIGQIPFKVAKARMFLAELHAMHTRHKKELIASL